MSTKMKAAQISKAGGDWELVERDIPEPGPGQVRVKVEACGICHSDALVKDGVWPGLHYPRVPGHEIAGRVDAVGANVTSWAVGQRVGVGWHGGHCFVCEQCRRGDFAMCVNRKVTGIDFDGGYAEYLIARAETLAAPDNPDAILRWNTCSRLLDRAAHGGSGESSVMRDIEAEFGDEARAR